MPVPVLGLVAQRHLEDAGDIGFSSFVRYGRRKEMSIALTYVVWRNPDDRSDPVNSVGDTGFVSPPAGVADGPFPPWRRERIEQLRRPMLWEAVRTTWRRTPLPAGSRRNSSIT